MLKILFKKKKSSSTYALNLGTIASVNSHYCLKFYTKQRFRNNAIEEFKLQKHMILYVCVHVCVCLCV